jgi:hypothetical protein
MVHRREREHLRSPGELASLALAFQSISPQTRGDEHTARVRKGSISEQHVTTALSGLSVVTHVRNTEHFGPEDMAGLDLVVFLRPTIEAASVESVTAQVKSSDGGIAHFRRVIGNRYGMEDHEIDAWLVEERLMLLNGSEPRRTIQRDFLSQLTPIRRAARHATG